jgi:hypothetical protein
MPDNAGCGEAVSRLPLRATSQPSPTRCPSERTRSAASNAQHPVSAAHAGHGQIGPPTVTVKPASAIPDQHPAIEQRPAHRRTVRELSKQDEVGVAVGHGQATRPHLGHDPVPLRLIAATVASRVSACASAARAAACVSVDRW